MLYKKDPKMLNQFQYCEREQVPYLVIVGQDERDNGGVKIRNAVSREEVRYLHIKHALKYLVFNLCI